MNSSQPARRSNRGGGYVEAVQVTSTTDGGHCLEFRGPAGAVGQIRVGDPRYVVVGTVRSLGSQCLRAPGSQPTPVTRSLLQVLQRVLTLPVRTNVDFALALDWYKLPVEGEPGGTWRDTATGYLVSHGKYWYKGQPNYERRRVCGRALAARLTALVNEHPLLRGVDSVAAVPGHDPKIVGFGAELAAATARRSEKDFIRCTGPSVFRTPAKDLQPTELESAIRNKFACPDDLRGRSVLIVDDVYRSGVTMAETARALRAAGATQVVGLCPVRTLRS